MSPARTSRSTRVDGAHRTEPLGQAVGHDHRRHGPGRSGSSAAAAVSVEGDRADEQPGPAAGGSRLSSRVSGPAVASRGLGASVAGALASCRQRRTGDRPGSGTADELGHAAAVHADRPDAGRASRCGRSPPVPPAAPPRRAGDGGRQVRRRRWDLRAAGRVNAVVAAAGVADGEIEEGAGRTGVPNSLPYTATRSGSPVRRRPRRRPGRCGLRGRGRSRNPAASSAGDPRGPSGLTSVGGPG